MKGRLRRAAGDPVFDRYRDTFLSGSSTLYPRIAVYAGSGASHSWIWFADILERLGLFDVRFIDESSVKNPGLSGFDAFFIGGGDTYETASSLGEDGARAIEGFVREGGFYFGSCAGAYLVLSGVDLEPFTPFNLIDGGMLNVMAAPPEPRCLEHKYKSAYGDGWVFHPVYGEVTLALRYRKACLRVNAPIFGGPVIVEALPDEVLAEYSGFTERAAYLWPRREAEELMMGRAAVLRSKLDGGDVVVSGPHLEHPLYPAANAVAADVLQAHCAERPRRVIKPSRSSMSNGDAALFLKEIKRQVSNARIVGFGLEKMPVAWQLGRKVWEPEKIRMFLDCAWERLPFLEEHEELMGPSGELEPLANGYANVTRLSKSLKMRIESGQDSQAEASGLLLPLKELTARFLSLYFRLRLETQFGRD